MEKLKNLNKLDKTAGQSMDIVADNIAKLKELFPEILTENKIDFKVLQALLGEEIEVDDERYSFNWHGKAQSRKLAQTPSTGTLRPCPEESVNWDTTQNLFIEGDNLEVLKLLQKSYHKQVKMIYIDPPYNTGNDFVYPDNFHDNIQNYLELTGQSEGGKKISSNTEASGRYHTDWLNMMYPRLKLARNLITDDGIIFISIDDNELSNLAKLCDEIFGEDHFVATFVWKTRQASGKQVAHNNTSQEHEYLLAYTKNHEVVFRGVDRDRSSYTNPDNDVRGDWAKHPLDVGSTREERPNCFYAITDPETGIEYQANPNRVWAFAPESMAKLINEKKIIFHPQGKNKPYLKKFWTDLKSESKPITTWLSREQFNLGYNTEGTQLVNELFHGEKLFDYPKPLSLITILMEQVVGNNDLVMDFFAGSGTTGHALYEFNVLNSTNVRYILVQLPEKLDHTKNEQKAAADFCIKLGKPLNIAELTKERLRRANKKVQSANPDYQGDLGFKVFKLDSSNLKPWDADFDSLSQDLADATEVLKADRKPEDVLFEILLKYGLDLTLPIDTHAIVGKTVYEVGAGALIVCLDDGVTEAVAEGIGKLKEQLEPEVMRVVFKDSSFASDAAKVNAVQVLKQYGIDDVKSI